MWTRNHSILKGFRIKRPSCLGVSKSIPKYGLLTKIKVLIKTHKFEEFLEYIQLEHQFSHNVQVLKTKMVDFLMICTQNKRFGLVTI